MEAVCVYRDPTMYGTHGITAAVRHQRRALEAAGVAVRDKPVEPYDVFQVNWPGPVSFGQLQRAQKAGKAGVVFAHAGRDIIGGFTLSRVLFRPMLGWLLRLYNQGDRVIAPSQYTRNVLADFGVDEEKLRVVSNGVEADKVRFSAEKRTAYRYRFGLHRPTVVCIGQVIPRKAVEDFVEVARRLPQYQFVWYGHRMNRLFMFDRRMARAIRTAPDNVQFTGYVPDIQAAYSSGDVFFFPSFEENQGIVLLEAAICGLPIVARDLSVYHEWLTHGEQCLLGRDREEMVRLLQQAMEDKELRSRLKRSAAQTAETHALEQVGRSLVAIYEEVVHSDDGGGQVSS